MPTHLKRTGIQLCEPFSERRLYNKGRFRSTWRPPFGIQPKLNGERGRALVMDSRCILLSATGNIIATIPHINYAFSHLPNGEYDGEFYVHGWTLGKIHSVLSSTTTIHPKMEEMQFHIFDIVNEKVQKDRFSLLYNFLYIPLEFREVIQIVPMTIVGNLEAIMEMYKEYIGEGYEGFILRELFAYYVTKRSQLVMKYKPKEKDTYYITSINEAISETSGCLGIVGSFNCIDEEGNEFSVGAGKLTHSQRKEYWNMYLDEEFIPLETKLEIEYQSLSEKAGVPYFSVATKVLL